MLVPTRSKYGSSRAKPSIESYQTRRKHQRTRARLLASNETKKRIPRVRVTVLPVIMYVAVWTSITARSQRTASAAPAALSACFRLGTRPRGQVKTKLHSAAGVVGVAVPCVLPGRSTTLPIATTAAAAIVSIPDTGQGGEIVVPA